MKKIIFCFISFFFLIRCSDKVYSYGPNCYKDCKTYDYYVNFESHTEIDLDNQNIEYNNKWNITIKKSNDTIKYFLGDNNKLELTANNTTFLFEEFDNRFLLISECQPNEKVSSHLQLKRDKLWIFDTKDEQLYYSNLNGKLLRSECHARTIKSESHHINSPYGLVSIDVNEFKLLLLLETTHKILELELIKSIGQ